MLQALISFLALIVSLLALTRALSDHLKYKKRERELEIRISDLQRMLKFRGNLASEIAHEIKNPITAILCSAETLSLLLDKKLDENHKLSLRYIQEFGENLLKLVSDFLDLSRAEGGNIVGHPQSTDLAKIARSIIGLLEASAARKGVKLTNLIADKKVFVHVDPVHLKQILFNLLHNGIKFTPKGGEVAVRCTLAAEDHKVLISVEDNGAGVPPEKLQSVFDPYVKYETGDNQSGAGAGLGLALCKALVQISGGTIEMQSVLNQGTIISFSLAAVETAETPPIVETRVADGSDTPLEGRHYLLIHKDKGAGDAIARLIEACGGIVEQANEASQALHALSRARYDALFIDSSVKGVERESVLEIAQSYNTNLILGGFSEDEYNPVADARSIDKPFDGARLLSLLIDKS